MTAPLYPLREPPHRVLVTTSSTAAGINRPAPATSSPAWGRPVAVLALGSFAMGTDSFVLAGILPQIAHGLHISTGAAGQTITAFALAYGLTAPFLAALTSRLPRKPLLVVALALFVLANLASAAAPDLPLLLTARVVAGLGAALYTPNASAAAAALAGPAARGRALSVILGGLTVGTVFGVPVGTAIGQHLSWEAGLVFVAAVGALALLGVLVVLPGLPIPPAIPLARRFAVLANRRVVAMVAFMLLASGGSIMVYTYTATVLGQIAHIHGTGLAAALLAWGVGGILGSFGSGWLTDRLGAARTLTVAIALLIVTLAALTVCSSMVFVIVVMVLNGAAGWALATPNNHRLTALAPTLPSVVISFNSSGIYLGQALGAALGGILVDHGITARALCLTGVAVALAAAAVHGLIARPAPES
ncbi:MFS transporter [Streptomyces griseofuscus]|uniref:MFS transporter n=1 Tax=Streptomyces griseofuscus TaxID=146922 RepID=UPI0036C718E4